MQFARIDQPTFQEVDGPRGVDAGVCVGGSKGFYAAADCECIDRIDEGGSAGAADVTGDVDVVGQQRDHIGGLNICCWSVCCCLINVEQVVSTQSDITAGFAGPYAATSEDVDGRSHNADQICCVDAVFNRHGTGGGDVNCRCDGVESAVNRTQAAKRSSKQDLVVCCQ